MPFDRSRYRRLTLYHVAALRKARAINATDPYLTTDEWLAVMHDYCGIHHYPKCLNRLRNRRIAEMWED